MRRRMVLKRGVALATIGLAGCTGGDNTPIPTTRAPTETPASTPTQGAGTVTSTASSTDTGTLGNTTEQEPTTKASSPEETSPATDTPTSSPTRTPTLTPTPDQEVSVGPGSLTFEPETFEIPTGGTVLWVWESGGHNVKQSNTPTEADWTGTPGGEFETFDGGYTYRFTFEVPGEYDYYCAPHRSAGMTGSFSVG